MSDPRKIIEAVNTITRTMGKVLEYQSSIEYSLRFERFYLVHALGVVVNGKHAWDITRVEIDYSKDVLLYADGKVETYVKGSWEKKINTLLKSCLKNTVEANSHGQFFGCDDRQISDWDKELHVELVKTDHARGVQLQLGNLDEGVLAIYDFKTWDKIVTYVAEMRKATGL